MKNKGEVMKLNLDKYHYHELLDRAHVANDHFHEYVEKHIAVQENESLKDAAKEITSVMYKFYCLCSLYTVEKKMKEKEPSLRAHLFSEKLSNK